MLALDRDPAPDRDAFDPDGGRGLVVLTAISQDVEAQGRAAGEMVLTLLRDKRVPENEIVIPVT